MVGIVESCFALVFPNVSMRCWEGREFRIKAIGLFSWFHHVRLPSLPCKLHTNRRRKHVSRLAIYISAMKKMRTKKKQHFDTLKVNYAVIHIFIL